MTQTCFTPGLKPVVLVFLYCVVLLQLPTIVHAQFTTIINSPPTIIGDFETIDSDTQLNVSNAGLVGDFFEAGVGSPDFSSSNVEVNISGGSVGDSFSANPGSTVNISGGLVGTDFDAFSGSTVNISGGSVDHHFRAHFNSMVNISGGAVGDAFNASNGSTVNLFGAELRLDGVLIGGLETVGNTVGLNVPTGSLLSGTFADGTGPHFVP